MRRDDLKEWSRSELEEAFAFFEDCRTASVPTRDWLSAMHVLIDRRIARLTEAAMQTAIDTPSGQRFFNESRGRITELEHLKEDGLGFLEELAEEIDKTKKPNAKPQ